MARFYLVAALAALGAFNLAQNEGWNLFADDAGAQQVRSPGAARSLHK